MSTTSSLFNDSAWYLYTYSGTRTFDRWLDTVKKTYAELKAGLGGSQNASKFVIQMVAFYCIEVGAIYKGEMAASKFKRCWKWPEFKDAFNDPDQALLSRWREMREVDRVVVAKRQELATFGIHPSQIVHDSRSREALRVLSGEVARRHGTEQVVAADGWMRELIAIYGPDPVLILGKRPHIDGDFYGRSKLMDRELIPNMLTSFFIERVIVEEYGDNLFKMKQVALGMVA